MLTAHKITLDKTKLVSKVRTINVHFHNLAKHQGSYCQFYQYRRVHSAFREL